MEALNRADIPPRPGPVMPLFRLRAGQTLTCLVYSSSLWGIWTHWDGGQSTPCFAERKHCDGCRRGHPKRWKGYLHVYCFERKQEGFAELTPTAAEMLSDMLGRDDALRGQRLTLKRTAAGNGRLHVGLLAYVPIGDALPPAKDPWETLRRLWGLPDSQGNGQRQPGVETSPDQ